MTYTLNIYKVEKPSTTKVLVNTFTGSGEQAYEHLSRCFRDVNPKTREGRIVRTRFCRVPYEDGHYKFTFVYDACGDGKVFTYYEYEFTK